MPTFAQYVNVAMDVANDNPDWRFGQALFNALVFMNPRVAEKIRGGEFDPFYNDDVVAAFLDYVELYW